MDARSIKRRTNGHGITSMQTTSGSITIRDPQGGAPRTYAIEFAPGTDVVSVGLNPEDFVVETACGSIVASGFVFGGSDSIDFSGGGVLNAALDPDSPPVLELDGQTVTVDELVSMTGGSVNGDDGSGGNGGDGGDGGGGGLSNRQLAGLAVAGGVGVALLR